MSPSDRPSEWEAHFLGLYQDCVCSCKLRSYFDRVVPSVSVCPNRGVHEDPKHDEGCEGAHKRNFAVCYSLPQALDGVSENFGLNTRGLEWEAEGGARVCDDAR